MVLVLTGHTLKDADYTIDFHRGTLLTEEETGAADSAIAGEIASSAAQAQWPSKPRRLPCWPP